MNAYIESFHRLLEYECLKRCMFQTYAEAYQEVVTYIEFYNNRRIHSSIWIYHQMNFIDEYKKKR
ncbi:transposase [Bacillus cytotoxicus]|nr:transposase [Bacillus cytotoxicus]